MSIDFRKKKNDIMENPINLSNLLQNKFIILKLL